MKGKRNNMGQCMRNREDRGVMRMVMGRNQNLDDFGVRSILRGKRNKRKCLRN